MKPSNEKITTEQFITWVVQRYDASISSPLLYALEKGIAEDYDFVHREKAIERRQVARIVHDTLRIEMKETDEDDWAAAKTLQDLYSCRTCVQHITQVYVKGIMDADKPNVFNVTGGMTHAEAATVILRMFAPSKRNPRKTVKQKRMITLSPVEAQSILNNGVLLDVRSHADYQEGHLAGSISLPLEEMKQIRLEKDRAIVLYCQKGFKSRLAAELLIEAGYTRVYTMPGVSDYPYRLIQ